MRIMALDIGDVRIGVAVSDALGMIASPFEVIDRKKVKAAKRIAEIVKEKDVKKIIAGLPLSLDGTEKVQAEKVRAFIEKLKTEVKNIEIETVDERFTTVTADSILSTNTKGGAIEKRKSVDKVAAAVILQSYLDRKR